MAAVFRRRLSLRTGAGVAVWRIGELAQRSGVSERTLRFYDRTGLLRPAHVSPGSGYRWYGADELARLERIRVLADLGVPLKDIADLLDAPPGQDRQAVARAVTHLRRQAAAVQAVLERAEQYLAHDTPFVGREVPAGPRRFRVRRLRVSDPALLGGHCDTDGGAMLTWLSGAEADGPGQAEFPAAVTVPDAPRAEVEWLSVPARRVVRLVLDDPADLVPAGRSLLARVADRADRQPGPTVEEHLRDGDGAALIVLEIPMSPAVPAPPDRTLAR